MRLLRAIANRPPTEVLSRPKRSGEEKPASPLRLEAARADSRSFAALRMTLQWCVWRVCLASLAAFAICSLPTAAGQAINVGQPPSISAKVGHVQFVAEPQTVIAGKPATLLLHFKVDPGFHINSHTPKSELLIATKIAVEETPEMPVKAMDFPAGTPYSFSFDPKEKLDVYTGEFTLVAHLLTKPGAHTLKAALHYQACDAAACYPPRLLAVEQPFLAK